MDSHLHLIECLHVNDCRDGNINKFWIDSTSKTWTLICVAIVILAHFKRYTKCRDKQCSLSRLEFILSRRKVSKQRYYGRPWSQVWILDSTGAYDNNLDQEAWRSGGCRCSTHSRESGTNSMCTLDERANISFKRKHHLAHTLVSYYYSTHDINTFV